jgi:hypothetical protein
MAVAAAVGLRMEPVNLPAHLMLRPAAPAAAPAGPSPGSQPAAAAGAGSAARAPAGAAGEEEEEEDGEEGGFGVLVDAFHSGEVCWLQDAEERLSGITGMQARGAACGAWHLLRMGLPDCQQRGRGDRAHGGTSEGAAGCCLLGRWKGRCMRMARRAGLPAGLQQPGAI